MKAFLELTILKNASPRENQGEIDEILLKTTLSSDHQGSRANISDKLEDIKSKLLNTQNNDKVTEFKFDI